MGGETYMADLAQAFLTAVGATFVGSIFFFVPLWGPLLVFRNVGVVIQRAPGLARFSILDGFILVGFLAGANAVTSLLRGEIPQTWFFYSVSAANVLIFAIWLRGLRFMERCEITQPRSRVLFQVLLHPMAIFGPSGTLMNGFIFLSMLEVFSEGLMQGLIEYTTHPLTIAAFFTLLASLFACYLARQLFKRMLDSEKSLTVAC